jgi:MFS family permease
MAGRISRSTSLRMLGGFVAVPPALGILGFFGFGLLESGGLLPYSGRLTNPTGAATGIGLVVSVLAFLMTVGGALPVVLHLSERGPLERKRLLVAGALLGNVPLALIIVGVTLVNLAAGTPERGRELYEIVPNLVRVLVGTFLGVSGAVIFWHIGVRDTELDPDYLALRGEDGRSIIPR